METRLNETQKELKKIGKEKGFLTKDNFETFYTSPITVKANIKRFFLLGFLKETETRDKYDFVEVK